MGHIARNRFPNTLKRKLDFKKLSVCLFSTYRIHQIQDGPLHQ